MSRLTMGYTSSEEGINAKTSLRLFNKFKSGYLRLL